MTALTLDGWAVMTERDRGLDDAVRTLGREVLGRRLFGYCAQRGGEICTRPIVRVRKSRGIVEAHTAQGDVFRLGEMVWSRIGQAPKEGSER